MTTAVYDGLAPQAEPLVTERPGRATDASRLTFPVQMLIGAIVMTAAIIGAVYGLTGGIRESQLEMRSEIRDIKTRLDAQKENIDLKFDNMRLEMNNGELRKALLERMNPDGRK